MDTPFAPERGAYAEETARVIDAEVKRLVSSAESTARRILTEKRTYLDGVAAQLLVKEIIEGAELREMLARVPPVTAPPS
jgi:cell division protease FtsH